MNNAMLQDAIANGTHSWDVLVQRLLAICLLSATGVRAGDVVLGTFYDDLDMGCT